MNKFKIGDRVVVTASYSADNVGAAGDVTEVIDGDYYVIDSMPNMAFKEDCLDFYAGDKYAPVVEATAIPTALYKRLKYLGITPDEVRAHNVGASDYSKHTIQPWSIWLDYNLNPWDADIVKRVLRVKDTDPRIVDYEKIIHICEERIRQLEIKEE